MSLTAVRIVTAADVYPVSLSEAKAHLRITHNAEDDLIQSYIAAATDWAQTFTRRIFIDTEVTIKLDRFPESGDSVELVGASNGVYRILKNDGRKKDACKRNRAILLPGGFVTAVNDIVYTDTNGAPQTLTGPTSAAPGTDYQEDLTDDEWAYALPTPSIGWPSVDSDTVNAVSVNYQVGWLDIGDMPEVLRSAVKFKMADLFTIRDTIDAGNKTQLLKVAENLCEPYVVPNY